MVTWNDAQQRAIFTKNKNILISASAGAGKTSVLIARLMHLIEDEGVGVDEILAMTFSEAAANEMKKRLASSLHKALKEDQENVYLKKQLASLNNANISTIHGFCLNIMKEYYYMIHLDKRRIDHPMDEGQASTLKQQAMQMALDKVYQNPQLIHLVRNFTNRIEHNGSLEAEIMTLATLANSKPDPMLFLDECIVSYKVITSLKDLNQMIAFYFFESFIIQVSLLLDLVKQTNAELEEIIMDKELHLEGAMKALKEQDYGLFRSYMMLAIKVKLPAESKGIYIKEIADKEKSMLDVLFEEKTLVEHYNGVLPNMELFVYITKAYLENYQQLKEAAQVIDFDDMEHYAIQILKANEGFVAKQYQKKFKAIMVDEFQDSNDVQDELVQLISREDNVFRVGDIKQSIYGFRHALPSIMKGLIKNQKESDEIIYLSHNYRSSKKIVDFNNELFEQLMNIEGISSSYLKEDKVETGTPQQEAYTKPVVLHLIDKKSVDEDKAYTTSDLKASYLANQIQEMHAQGYDYKDIVVLVRSNAKMIEIKDALDEVNVPCFYNKQQGFYDSVGVQSVLSYLKALVNPHNDLAFISILTSTIYQKSAEALANIKLVKKDDESYFESVKDDETYKDFRVLYEHLNTYKLSELLESIYNMNDFYMSYANSQEKANLDLLYEMVCTYEKEQAMSIYGFLAYLEDQKEIQVAEAMPIGVNDDVVRIMSIHRSKGLQFKVVYLYSSSIFSSKDGEGCMSFDESLKISMKYLDETQSVVYPTITSIAFSQKKLQAYLEEEMRLLYVATTRAQEEMHIIDVGVLEDTASFDINEFYKLKGYTNWIRKAFVNSTSHLLKYNYVDTMWETKVNEEVSVSYDFISYTRNVDAIQVVSPSDSEIKVMKPPKFKLTSDEGFMRGTNLHRMVECLPLSIWTKEIIQAISIKEKIVLEEHDIEVLITLYQNETFQSCFRMQDVYHEYPFMIKKQNEIVHGFMDFVAMDDTNVIMIDFKSDRGVGPVVLLERYVPQIQSYQDALIQLFPTRNVMTYIYSFELGMLLEVERNDT